MKETKGKENYFPQGQFPLEWYDAGQRGDGCRHQDFSISVQMLLERNILNIGLQGVDVSNVAIHHFTGVVLV